MIRHPFRAVPRLLGLVLVCLMGEMAHADGLHPLWALHGKHNTVYLLGSIHVLRPSDYPLAPEMIRAYGNAAALVMEVNLQEIDTAQLQTEMLSKATVPQDRGLPEILGKERYGRAYRLAHEVGVELPSFDQYAPWFAAEAISQLQLMQLGFKPQAGVEMFFLDKARSDGKSIAGLETVRDQIALFQSMPMSEQADYLLSSLEQAHDLPKEVDEMVRAWQRGDTAWFASQMKSDLGHDPKLYQTLLVSRNRKWVPKIEAMLNDHKNYLVIVGTGHLVGRNSVIDLLQQDGISASQL